MSYDGQFVIMLPPQDAGTSIKIYALDHISRNSRVTTITVQEAGPNAPVVNDVSNIEKSVTGYVPSSSNADVVLQIGDTVYKTRTDKDGRFAFTFKDQLYAGQSLVVMASDEKDNRERFSIPVEVIVKTLNPM